LVRVHKSTRSTAIQQMFSVIRNGQVELFPIRTRFRRRPEQQKWTRNYRFPSPSRKAPEKR
jgi:hypothetical protein